MSAILCIDVGLANIGAVVIDPTQLHESPRRIIEFAYFHTEKSDKKVRWRHSDDKARRVQEASRFYADIVRKHGIRRFAAELPIGGAPNSQAATDLAYASACLLATMETLDVVGEFYAPREVKQALAGRANATKHQMMNAAAGLYPELLELFPTMEKREHVSDAVGVYLAARHGTLFRL